MLGQVIRASHKQRVKKEKKQVHRVIHDILDVVDRPQGSYAESFVSISLLLAEIYAKQRK